MYFPILGLLSLAGSILCAPSLTQNRAEDWKTALGWDGKTTTPAQLDPSNVIKPTPGVSMYSSQVDSAIINFLYLSLLETGTRRHQWRGLFLQRC
jgi:hypothetical protein